MRFIEVREFRKGFKFKRPLDIHGGAGWGTVPIEGSCVRGLEKALYTRREFLGLIGTAASAYALGCLGKKPKEPIVPKKRFTPELRIQTYDEFCAWMDAEPWNKEYAGLMELYDSPKKYEVAVQNIENMLRVLKEYSPEWYEKTMYAGEVVKVSSSNNAGMSGSIGLSTGTVSDGGSRDVKEVLRANARFPHEVQHVIDLNTYFRKPPEKLDAVESLELELRSGITEGTYSVKVGLENKESEYDFQKRVYYRLKAKYIDDLIKEKDRIDRIERMYFDDATKTFNTSFLNESWEEFKKL